MRILTDTRKKIFLVSFFLLMISSPASQAFQYKIYEWWDGDTAKINWCDGAYPTLNLNTKAFAKGSAIDKAMIESINEWNNNPSQFQFSFVYSDTANYEQGDEIVDVAFVDKADPNLAKAPAMTLGWTLEDCILDADVIISNGTNWTVSHNKDDHSLYSSTGGRSLQTTVMHELGHVLGLSHENKYYGIMGADWKHASVNGDIYTPYAGADGKGGEMALYPLSNKTDATASDWAISHYVYSAAATGTSEYANAVRSSVYDSLTGIVLSTKQLDEKSGKVGPSLGITTSIYQVFPGQYVDAEFTLEAITAANGSTVDLNTYYSVDDEIQVTDEQLSGMGIACSTHNCVDKQLLEMTIPYDAKVGVAYIGAIVNPQTSSLIDEYSYANNATYIPVVVEKPPFITNFSLISPVTAKAKKLGHGDELLVVSQDANTFKATIAFTDAKFDDDWDVDWIYRDFKTGEDKIISGKLAKGKANEFTLANVSDVGDGKLMVRLHNAKRNFGSTYPIKGVVVSKAKPADVTPTKPQSLFQTPANGLLKSLESYSGKSLIKLNLGAQPGQSPQHDSTALKLIVDCELKVSVISTSKVGNPVELYAKKAQASPWAIINEEKTMMQDSYKWQAQTVCGLKGNAYTPYAESQAVVYSGLPLTIAKTANSMCLPNPAVSPDAPEFVTVTYDNNGQIMLKAQSSDNNCDGIKFEVETHKDSLSCGLPKSDLGTVTTYSAYYKPQDPLESIDITGQVVVPFDPEFGIFSWQVRAVDATGKKSGWVVLDPLKGSCSSSTTGYFKKPPTEWQEKKAKVPGGEKDFQQMDEFKMDKTKDPTPWRQKAQTPRGR